MNESPQKPLRYVVTEAAGEWQRRSPEISDAPDADLYASRDALFEAVRAWALRTARSECAPAGTPIAITVWRLGDRRSRRRRILRVPPQPERT